MKSNYLTPSLITKGYIYSDPLTKGIIILANTKIITDDGDVIFVPGTVPIEQGIGGGGAGGDLKFGKEYYDRIKKALKPDQKIKEIEVRLVRQYKKKDFEISVKLLEKQLLARFIEEKLPVDTNFKITVELI